MPRVHRQVAAKAYPSEGIKKGDTYYSWKFRYGGLRRSLAYPKPSQLTQSEFLGKVYELREQLDLEGAMDEGWRDELVSELENLQSDIDDKLNNLPDGLRENSSSGQLLQERSDWLENTISGLGDMYWEVDGFSWDDLMERAKEHCDGLGSLDEIEDTEQLMQAYLTLLLTQSGHIASDLDEDELALLHMKAEKMADNLLLTCMNVMHYDEAMELLNEQ